MKILLPLNLSDGSRAALAIAMRLAQRSGATLVLLHVVELNIAGEELGIPRTRLVNESRCDAEQQLRHLVETAPAQVPTEILVCEGKPAETIVEMAARLAVGAIVMCSHVYRGWRKWLNRNTALQVLRDAPCPVYCVSPNVEPCLLKHEIVPVLWSDAAPRRMRSFVTEQRCLSNQL
jgi:universal stress protein A